MKKASRMYWVSIVCVRLLSLGAFDFSGCRLGTDRDRECERVAVVMRR